MRFTVAELDFLLAQEAAWPALRERWGFRPSGAPDETRAHGAASLLAREQARFDDGELLVDSATIDLARRLSAPDRVVQLVGLTPNEVTLATYLVAADGRRSMVLVIAPGVLSVDALRSDDDAETQLAEIVGAALTLQEGAYVARDTQGSGFTCSRNGERWLIGDHEVGAEEFVGELAATLGASRAGQRAEELGHR